jgi:type I restriction enzyme S subunit
MTVGLRPYPEYKDSGLPWLNRIPACWEEKRAKFFFREVDERSATGTEQLMSVSHKTGVTPRKANVTMFMAESNVGCKICRPGDLVINTMWAWMAAMGVSRQTGLVSPSYGVYRPRKALPFLPDYVDHLVRTQPYVSEYICRSTGIRPSRLRLYPNDFLDIPIVCPPHEEQEAIVKFIGHHDRLVRRFIRNRRRLIGVLNEQKQAIINRAVTRSLDPNVPLKPSGIDWLGDIPEHWEKRRLKFLVRNVKEQTGSKLPDEVYVALEHVESWTGRITLPDGEVVFDSQVKRFQPDDVLFGKLRPYLAKVAKPQVPGVCVGEFLILRIVEPGILPEFLEQKLRSKQFINLVNSSTFGAKMPRADWTFIGNLAVVYPPTHDEQRAIISQIGEQTATLQAAIDQASREIDLIREYRTRLIADVVTGKLDVRHLAPPPEAMAAEAGAEDLEDELPEEDEAGFEPETDEAVDLVEAAAPDE